METKQPDGILKSTEYFISELCSSTILETKWLSGEFNQIHDCMKMVHPVASETTVTASSTHLCLLQTEDVCAGDQKMKRVSGFFFPLWLFISRRVKQHRAQIILQITHNF